MKLIQSIRTKILASQVSLVFIVVLLIGLSSYALISEQHTKEEWEQLSYIAQWNVRLMSNFIEQKKATLERVAQSEYVEKYAEKFQEQMLLKYMDRFRNEFPELAFVNQNGEEEIKMHHGFISDDFKNVSQSEIFQRATAKPNTPIFAFPQSPFNSDSMIEFAYCRLNFFDECVGVIIGKCPIKSLSELFVKSEEDEGSYVLFTDSQGRILAHENPMFIGKYIPDTVIMQDLTEHEVITDRFDLLGEDSFVAMTPIKEYGFTSLAVYSAEDFLAPPHKMRERAAMFLLSSMVIAYIASVIMASNLSKPIKQLSDITKEIATGNFKHRIKVTSKDEVGILEQAFNDMLEHLNQSTTSIEALNQEIKQRQQAEQRQAELLHEIEATNKELTNFAHIVSHDLKAPLRGIRSIACWLEEDYGSVLDEAGKQQLLMLTQRVERMRNLIDGILQYSRVGRTHEEIRPIDLDKAIPEVIDLLAAPENMTISIAKPLPTVNFETTRIQQIFQNLLSNALKYIDKPQGEITIDYTEDDDFWTFTVSDNGPGIEEKYYDKIFGIFQTLNPRDEYESTGIGLAVIKKTVENAGGRIWVAAEMGKGSTFSFTLSKHLECTPESDTPKPKPFILNEA